jgi:hypothetical protein
MSSKFLLVILGTLLVISVENVFCDEQQAENSESKTRRDASETNPNAFEEPVEFADDLSDELSDDDEDDDDDDADDKLIKEMELRMKKLKAKKRADELRRLTSTLPPPTTTEKPKPKPPKGFVPNCRRWSLC